jgi:hypothetical protein
VSAARWSAAGAACQCRFRHKELQVRPSGEEWRAEEGDMYTGGTLPHAALGEVSLTAQREYSDG